MNGDELKSGMRDFLGGSDHRYSYGGIFPWALITPGVKWLADEGQCYWLMDLIFSHQREIKKAHSERYYFQVWSLAVNEDRSCVATCDDGDGLVMAQQEIEWTDFPMDSVKLYCCYEDDRAILLLPEEY